MTNNEQINTEPIHLLLIDSSGNQCNVAYTQGLKVLEEYNSYKERIDHSSTLAPLIDKIFSKYKLSDLNAIVISSGPGSYTGLRIGSSFAKGLAHGLNIPLIAISSLELMANGFRKENSIDPKNPTIRLVPMIDARRMEVYASCYNSSLQQVKQEEAIILEEGIFPYETATNDQYYIFGNGAEKCIKLWNNQNIKIDGSFKPKANYMLELALDSYTKGNFVDRAYWTPNYLKDYKVNIAVNKVLKELKD